MNEREVVETNVKSGEFPFPLTDGPVESRYLTWLRNHSNYMATRGFMDYLRMVGVLVRGIVVNFLIFLPYLLAIALVLGYCHHWMLERPYRATVVVLSIALSWILLFPILMPLYKIFSYKRSLRTGSDSSVKQRDLYERSFGGIFFAIFAVALLESIPWILELRNDLFQNHHLGWKGSVASVAGALAFLSGSDKLFSVLKGAKQKVAMLVIGILGLLVPFLVILYAADFLVYGLPPTPNVMYSPLAVPIVCVIGIVVAIPLGLLRRAFSVQECVAVVGMLVGGLVLAVTVIMGINSALSEEEKNNDELLAIVDPLERVAMQFENFSNQAEMTPEVAALVEQVVIGEREYKRMDKEIRRQIAHYAPETKKRPTVVDQVTARHADEDSDQTFIESWSEFYVAWNQHQQLAKWRGEYFALGQRIVTLGDALSAQPRGSLEPLRREVARLANDNLLREVEQHARGEAFEQAADLAFLVKTKPDNFVVLSPIALPSKPVLNAFSVETQVQHDVANMLRHRFLAWHLLQQIQNLSINSKRFDPNDQIVEDYQIEVSRVHERLRRLDSPEGIVKTAKRQALADLQTWTVEEMATLIDVDRLFELVKKENFTSDKAKHARLAGKVELAKLIRKQALIELVLSFDADQERSLTTLARERLIELALPIWQTDTWQEDPIDMQSSLVVAGKLAVLATGNTNTENPWDETVELIPGKIESDESIACAAALRLATFSVSHLGIIARGGLYADDSEGGTLEPDESENDTEYAESLNHAEYEGYAEYAEYAEFAKSLAPRRIVERVRKAVIKDDSEIEVGSDDFPNVYLVQLAMKVLAESARVRDPLNEATSESLLREFARAKLVEIALRIDPSTPEQEAEAARGELRNLFSGSVGGGDRSLPFKATELANIAMAKFAFAHSPEPNKLVATLMFGEYAVLERDKPGVDGGRGGLAGVKKRLSEAVFQPKAIYIVLLAGVIWLACWFTVDVNMTSIHGLYRDRLASAFLVGEDTQGDVDIEEDIDLEDICRYEARSIAPYHLINVALNLQGSKDASIRDRNSDFFIFSKAFIGGSRTGYCRSDTMEQVFPQMSLASAMAISAGAASPNMGRSTSPLLVAFMTFLNIRMGYWIPNPGLLEERQDSAKWRQRKQREKQTPAQAKVPMGYVFGEVFAEELREIERRWEQVDPEGTERHLDAAQQPTVRHGLVGIAFSGGGIRSATINLGIAQVLHQRGIFDHMDYMSTVSGGGYLGSSISTLMRSRTKLSSEIAGTVTVEKERLVSEIAGTVNIQSTTGDEQIVVVTPSPEADDQEKRLYRFSNNAKLAVKENQEITEGQILIVHRSSLNRALSGSGSGSSFSEPCDDAGDQVVVVTRTEQSDRRTYRFSKDAQLNVKDRENVSAGKPLMKPRITKSQSEISGTVSVEHASTGESIVRVQGVHGDEERVYRFSKFQRLVVKTGSAVKKGQQLVQRHNTLGERFRWRVRPTAFMREMLSKVDETQPWVNLSDGGHLENLATIELLRRRCKFIFIGDGEADPDLNFNGLATLVRFSRIDLGIEIDIDLDELRLNKDGLSNTHWAIGRITYPKSNLHAEEEVGYLLYLKSSFTGDEDAVIKEYRHRNPTFPHESTADQFFDEGQFEAYRALGLHIAAQTFEGFAGQTSSDNSQMAYDDLEKWLTDLWKSHQKTKKDEEKDSATPTRRRAKKPKS